MIKPKPRQGAFQIRHPFQCLFQAFHQARVFNQHCGQIKPVIDGGGIGQRCRQPVGQKPPPGTGAGQINDRQQAAIGFARQRAGQFKRTAAGRVDFHDAARADLLHRLEVQITALLGLVQIDQQAAD